MKTITVTIPPGGKPVIEASGFSGPGCAAATKPIEDALGAKDAHREDKPEMFLSAPADLTQNLNA